MNPQVHCSTIHNSQDMEATQMSMTDDWIRKMWYIYTVEYSSAIKKNKIMPFTAIWMELETLIPSEVSQKEKDIPYDIIYIWNLIYSTNEPFHTKETHGLGDRAGGC